MTEAGHTFESTPVGLLIRRLDERAIAPSYKTERAAGLDLAACLPRGALPDPVVVGPRERVLIPTGWAVAIPPGCEGQVRARSGTALKRGLTLPNGVGTIDSDYRGELMVAIVNIGEVAQEIAHGERIAQLVIAPVMHATVTEVEALDETVRGAGGFGSTGTI